MAINNIITTSGIITLKDDTSKSELEKFALSTLTGSLQKSASGSELITSATALAVPIPTLLDFAEFIWFQARHETTKAPVVVTCTITHGDASTSILEITDLILSVNANVAAGTKIKTFSVAAQAGQNAIFSWLIGGNAA